MQYSHYMSVVRWKALPGQLDHKIIVTPIKIKLSVL